VMYLSSRRDVSFPVLMSKEHTSGIRRYGPCCKPGGHFPKFSKAREEHPEARPYSLNDIHRAYHAKDFLFETNVSFS
jgi:hypothetical protein